MVPGKHNLDVNVWDLPNNKPPPVPSPPSPIDLAAYSDLSSDFSISGNNHGQAPALGARTEKVHKDTENFQKYENKGLGTNINHNNNNNNFNRAKISPTGPVRNPRNMGPSQQHHPAPHHAAPRPATNAGPGSGPGPFGPPNNQIRRHDGGAPHPNRNIERSGSNYSSFRSNSDFAENAPKFEYRDENHSRPVEATSATEEVPVDPQLLLDELKDKNNYNPKVVDLNKATAAR